MRTVKEIARLTNISVRTLHYYDEIGLLKPTMITEAGYRLYDDKALELLQQILFFKELDMPLKEIKIILENPELDKNQLLIAQKNIMILKKERLERIIASIDDILKGENKMDFEIFNKTDIEQMYNAVINNMSGEQKEIFIKEYGSINEFKKHFLENASSEQTQKQFAKVVEWYGSKKDAMKAATNPENSKLMEAYSKRFDAVLKKLAAKVDSDINTLEVKEIIGELDFVGKQLYQMKDLSSFMLDMAEKYLHNKNMQDKLDKVYGEGSTLFIGQAITAYYKNNTVSL